MAGRSLSPWRDSFLAPFWPVPHADIYSGTVHKTHDRLSHNTFPSATHSRPIVAETCRSASYCAGSRETTQGHSLVQVKIVLLMGRGCIYRLSLLVRASGPLTSCPRMQIPIARPFLDHCTSEAHHSQVPGPRLAGQPAAGKSPMLLWASGIDSAFPRSGAQSTYQ